MNEANKQAILEHYQECYPSECCGLMITTEGVESYYPCDNISPDPNQFEIDPAAYVRASELGEIVAVVHSHPDGSTDLSMPDKVQMNLGKISWIITNGEDFAIHSPSKNGYQAPLLGRDYHHGVMDCYTLVKDYYQRELDIILSDYEYSDRWWEGKEHSSLYLDNFTREGFVKVEKLQKHDVILCRLGRTEHVNHALIFLDDGVINSEKTPPIIGGGLLLHHPYNRQSIREIYGQQWMNRAVCIVRHKELL